MYIKTFKSFSLMLNHFSAFFIFTLDFALEAESWDVKESFLVFSKEI